MGWVLAAYAALTFPNFRNSGQMFSLRFLGVSILIRDIQLCLSVCRMVSDGLMVMPLLWE
ncbi:hypothetical protein [Neisseria weixii]|uniref:hypothetical protein n=1 Tax=Neisseria weixii TaxID=1853276 RepID=UPI00359F16CD